MYNHDVICRHDTMSCTSSRHSDTVQIKPEPVSPRTANLQQQQDLEYLRTSENQNQYIQEREQGIREIETAVVEVNQMFQDLASIVATQGQLIGEFPARIFPEFSAGVYFKCCDFSKKFIAQNH